MGANRGLDVGIGLAGKLDDPPLLEALRNGEDQQSGMGDAGRLQDAGGRGVTVDGGQATLAQLLDASPVLSTTTRERPWAFRPSPMISPTRP
jgi:hypothetical protein